MSIVNKVKETLVKAASTFREDQKQAYLRAIAKEQTPLAKWVLQNIFDNAEVAEKNKCPLCDDTGIPHIFIEIGPNHNVSYELINDIHIGIAEGLRELPGRPMAIKGNDNQRLDQSGELDTDPAALLPSPILIKQTNENYLKLTILMLGGGPAIRGITQRIFHKHSIETIIDEIVQRSTEAVSKLGCSPCTLAVGIGRSQFEATSLMIEAMAYGDYNKQSEMEKEITLRVNANRIGPLGLGGNTSVLATFVKVGPQRASGVRIVSLRPCCCFEPRRSSVLL